MYRVIAVILVLLLKKIKVNKIRNLRLQPFQNSTKITFSLNIISIAGIPPLAGFFIKAWVVINIASLTSIVLILMIFSLVSLVYYTRMVYGLLINKALKIKTAPLEINKYRIITLLALRATSITPIIVLLPL